MPAFGDLLAHCMAWIMIFRVVLLVWVATQGTHRAVDAIYLPPKSRDFSNVMPPSDEPQSFDALQFETNDIPEVLSTGAGPSDMEGDYSYSAPTPGVFYDQSNQTEPTYDYTEQPVEMYYDERPDYSYSTGPPLDTYDYYTSDAPGQMYGDLADYTTDVPVMYVEDTGRPVDLYDYGSSRSASMDYYQQHPREYTDFDNSYSISPAHVGEYRQAAHRYQQPHSEPEHNIVDQFPPMARYIISLRGDSARASTNGPDENLQKKLHKLLSLMCDPSSALYGIDLGTCPEESSEVPVCQYIMTHKMKSSSLNLHLSCPNNFFWLGWSVNAFFISADQVTEQQAVLLLQDEDIDMEPDDDEYEMAVAAARK